MNYTFSFFEYFFDHLSMAWPLLATIALLITTLGVVVGFIESWGRFDSIYWAFITATTVGYGDIRPLKRVSRVLSVLIALIGFTFTGIIVALAIDAATRSFSGGNAPVTTSFFTIEKVQGITVSAHDGTPLRRVFRRA